MMREITDDVTCVIIARGLRNKSEYETQSGKSGLIRDDMAVFYFDDAGDCG